MSLTATPVAPYSVAVSSAESDLLDLGVPVLAGSVRDEYFARAKPAGRHGALHLGEWDDWLIGGAVVPIRGNLEATTLQLYETIFSALGRKHLARIWNYVPAINETGPGGLENYRLFCRGRSLAFEKQFGADFGVVLPAASAVGGPAGLLSVVFAAHDHHPRHLENPLQLPAYLYPKEYGPRSPSFSRATVWSGQPANITFISGTAAIRGHKTIAPQNTTDQLTLTLENLRVISAASGLGEDLGASASLERTFKVYVRHPEDHPLIARFLETNLFKQGDVVTYLRADICREALNVEIEATLRGAGPASFKESV